MRVQVTPSLAFPGRFTRWAGGGAAEEAGAAGAGGEAGKGGRAAGEIPLPLPRTPSPVAVRGFISLWLHQVLHFAGSEFLSLTGKAQLGLWPRISSSFLVRNIFLANRTVACSSRVFVGPDPGRNSQPSSVRFTDCPTGF